MKKYAGTGIYNYERIITEELIFNKLPVENSYAHKLQQGSYFQAIASYILEIAKNSTVLRCCGKYGHLTEDAYAWESDAAHTNLVMALVDSWLDFVKEVRTLNPPYSLRSIHEAVRIHDLPENETGDTSDDGERDNASKILRESIYLNYLGKWCYPPSKTLLYHETSKILAEMNNKDTMLGRGIYLADKIAAIIMTLCYDSFGHYPLAFPDDINLAKNACKNMDICDHRIRVEKEINDIDEEEILALANANPFLDIEVDPYGNIIGLNQTGYLLSELWAIDYFHDRKMYQYDDTGFFTATLIMITLMVNNSWYDWREDDYYSKH